MHQTGGVEIFSISIGRGIDRFSCEAGHHLREPEALGNGRANETKSAVLLLVIKEAIPKVFIWLTTQPRMAYDELKQVVIGDISI